MTTKPSSANYLSSKLSRSASPPTPSPTSALGPHLAWRASPCGARATCSPAYLPPFLPEFLSTVTLSMVLPGFANLKQLILPEVPEATWQKSNDAKALSPTCDDRGEAISAGEASWWYTILIYVGSFL